MGKLFSNAQYFAVREGLKGKSQEEMGRTRNAKYGRWQFGLPSSPFPHGNVEEQIYFGWQSHL